MYQLRVAAASSRLCWAAENFCKAARRRGSFSGRFLALLYSFWAWFELIFHHRQVQAGLLDGGLSGAGIILPCAGELGIFEGFLSFCQGNPGLGCLEGAF